ncbi:DUF1707 domain-containing protein [Mycobacterium talmoniae]|uniref:Uncharacterized protein n=1 Tax=Mycobacterium talmoniae TaxID=1858794 RepID=A0A1S1N3J8_9MYCO|nr:MULTISPECIES: DUF1707 domain-containing protein [Mycobacterium]OHU95673.1 hypothetical protein BKN37_22970 [Mycobacterium talmoniae]PQM46273.1 hypothetical protein C1Y40_03553 [Mycobacterium talmoniae]TDH48168.1 DUF1707 domain-containing protein [Mycobacterium eburneum]
MTTTLVTPTAPRRRASTNPAARVGDPERERTAAQLGQAFTQGYLSMTEYETRLGGAFAAQTVGALNQLIEDLPIERISRRDPKRRAAQLAAARRGVRIHLAAYLAVSVLMLGIWLATAVTVGAWYFWPVWPILGWGIGVVSHAIPVRACAGNNGRG